MSDKQQAQKNGPDDHLGITGEVVAVITDTRTGKQRIHRTTNIVTDAGDTHYAQQATGETPDNAFGRLVLGTAGNAPAKDSDYSDVTSVVSGSEKAFDANYPKTDDDDGDNSGAAVDAVSYRVSYLTSEANDTDIDRVAITNASPGASEPLLSYATFGAAFTKTSADTLKVFVNHTMNGA